MGRLHPESSIRSEYSWQNAVALTIFLAIKQIRLKWSQAVNSLLWRLARLKIPWAKCMHQSGRVNNKERTVQWPVIVEKIQVRWPLDSALVDCEIHKANRELWFPCRFQRLFAAVSSPFGTGENGDLLMCGNFGGFLSSLLLSAGYKLRVGKGLKVDVCENRAEGNVKGGLRWLKEWKLSFGS